MALIDFTLSNARRFYSSMGNPSGWKGLILDTFYGLNFVCGEDLNYPRIYKLHDASLKFRFVP